jgi:hypothetical protein
MYDTSVYDPSPYSPQSSYNHALFPYHVGQQMQQIQQQYHQMMAATPARAPQMPAQTPAQTPARTNNDNIVHEIAHEIPLDISGIYPMSDRTNDENPTTSTTRKRSQSVLVDPIDPIQVVSVCHDLKITSNLDNLHKSRRI